MIPIAIDSIKDAIYNAPLSLIALSNNSECVDYINSFLPYSTGFELECWKKDKYDEKAFKSIPDILDVNTDSSEQRYRIPNGLRGFICLYNICTQLKVNSELDLGSGIHYHVDMTDCYRAANQAAPTNNDWIIEELKTWETCKDLTNAYEGAWYRYNGLHTIEFRIGEMSFDYPVLVKRIIHCNSIAKRIKDSLGIDKPIEYLPIDNKLILKYIQDNILSNKLGISFEKPKKIIEEVVNVKEVIKNRTIKM